MYYFRRLCHSRPLYLSLCSPVCLRPSRYEGTPLAVCRDVADAESCWWAPPGYPQSCRFDENAHSEGILRSFGVRRRYTQNFIVAISEKQERGREIEGEGIAHGEPSEIHRLTLASRSATIHTSERNTTCLCIYPLRYRDPENMLRSFTHT